MAAEQPTRAGNRPDQKETNVNPIIARLLYAAAEAAVVATATWIMAEILDDDAGS